MFEKSLLKQSCLNKEGNSKISALEVARNLNERLNYQPLFENMCPRSSPGTPLSSLEGARTGQERAAEIGGDRAYPNQ